MRNLVSLPQYLAEKIKLAKKKKKKAWGLLRGVGYPVLYDFVFIHPL